jgi:hypothetical protein
MENANENEEARRQSKKLRWQKRLISVSFPLLFVINSIMLATVAIRIDIHELTSFGDILSTVSKRESILPLKTIRMATQCQESEETLILYKWNGSAGGCICRLKEWSKGMNDRLSDVYRMERMCQKKEGCLEKVKMEPVYSRYMKWYTNGRLFCVSRYLSETVGTADSSFCKNSSTNRVCPNGLCVEQNEPCPITRLSFEKNYELSVERGEGPPIISLEMSLNDKPCFSDYEAPKRIGLEKVGFADYPFLLRRNTGCRGGHDHSSLLIDRTSETTFFALNSDQAGDVPSKLYLYPFFLELEGNTFNLYSKHSFGFSQVRTAHSRRAAKVSASPSSSKTSSSTSVSSCI